MRLDSKKILVIGDIMIDEYVFGMSTRLSPEAPVPVVKADIKQKHLTLGGAGNVAKNLRMLGAQPYLIGVVGNDTWKGTINYMLDSMQIARKGLVVDPSRCTTRKVRIMSNNCHIARLDYEETKSVDDDIEESINTVFNNLVHEVDIILISDYGKGVLTSSVIDTVIRAQEYDKPVIVDPRLDKNGNLIQYKNSYLIKPNKKEAQSASTFTNLYNAGIAIGKTTGSNVLITKGMDGMELFPSHSTEPQNFPAHTAKDVYDVSGAGDVVLAVLGLALANNWKLEKAIELANVGGSIAVSKTGTDAVTKKELEDDWNRV